MPARPRTEIAGLKVRQWLNDWDGVQFDASAHRRQPEPYFYLLAMNAGQLRALCGIQRRTTEDGSLRSQDLGIQRRHDPDRSSEIREFARYGFPWSEMSEAKRRSGKYEDLRKPGWLPTAIVVNILKTGDTRRGRTVADNDAIELADASAAGQVKLSLPRQFSGADWRPRDLHPMEVIDGQHRLWAFEDDLANEEFELPVVAFHGLDISWQAYLFWTINIKPKRINASLAFDLYPLLRTEDWLEKLDGHSIYRETRAQELTEALWSHPDSPWRHRINMLGESGLRQVMVSQAAWVRSLMATFVKSWEGRGVSIGGLFGGPVGQADEVLPWTRAQQAAFLILAGSHLKEEVASSSEPWAKALRKFDTVSQGDEAFCGSYSLLNADQGVRGLMHSINDLCFVQASELRLQDWTADGDGSASDETAVSESLRSIRRRSLNGFLQQLGSALAKYDWRTSSTPGLTESERTLKATFRGSGGYREIRRQLVQHLAATGEGEVSDAAHRVSRLLRP